MAEQTCPCCGANLRISCNTAHPEHDCHHPDGHERPVPDWADVREMARNAGLIRSADYDPRESRYGHRDEDGYLKDNLGWVLHEWRGRDRRRLRVDLVGPLDGVRRTATLVDPTPAEVLTAASLVGLIGDAS